MDSTLKNFMEEHFCFKSLLKAGFFTKEMKKDYEAQAKRVCTFFGYKSVYEYGAVEMRAHITYADPYDKTGLSSYRPLHVDENGKLQQEPFITVIPSIYE